MRQQRKVSGRLGKCLSSALTAVVILLCACSHDTDIEKDGSNGQHVSQSNAEYVSFANFSMAPYTSSDGEEEDAATRATLHYDVMENHIYSYWDNENAIGVFPTNPRNSQILFSFINEEEHTETGKVMFTGAGWGLQKGNSYAAYYPYEDLLGSTSYDQIPMVFTRQVQTGNKNLDHIGAGYDFMHAQAQTAQESTITFDFKHVNGLYRIRLIPPVAGTWTCLSLTNINGDKVFCDSATLNVDNGEITRLRDTCRVTLRFEELQTYTDKDTIVAFISTVPIADSGRLLLELRNDEGTSFYATTKGSTWMKAGQFSSITKKVATSNRLYVDLGLTSGNLWSICNLGATLPWEHGFYYSWGMHWPLGCYYWTNYLYCYNLQEKKMGNSMSELYKYTIEDGFTDGTWYRDGTFQGDGKKRLDVAYTPQLLFGEMISTDDAARHSWGGDWQIPTPDDFRELMSECTYVWTINYMESGMNGYLFTGPNGQTLFFPAAGWVGMDNSRDYKNVEMWKDEDGFYHQEAGYGLGDNGYYWTSDLSDDYSFDAKEFKFNSVTDSRGNTKVYPPVITTTKRYVGSSIRPVMHRH